MHRLARCQVTYFTSPTTSGMPHLDCFLTAGVLDPDSSGGRRNYARRTSPSWSTTPRFLILPWITIPNLGSHILAIIRQRLPLDWTERYNTAPVLVETFVETPRYTGAVYRASGWIHVGTTQGRGRYDRQKQFDKPKKDVWLRPLRKDWKRTLNRGCGSGMANVSY